MYFGLVSVRFSLVAVINNNWVMGSVVYVEVTVEPIYPEVIRKLVADPSAGAIVVFSGDVRDNDSRANSSNKNVLTQGAREVASLEYEAHPSAEQVLREVAIDVSKRHELVKVALAHRHGAIPIGESAFIVAVSAKHRASAFTACSELVDEAKARIPIWKHQIFKDGTDEWVNFA